MRASMSFVATLVFAVGIALLRSRAFQADATPCEVLVAWEAMQQGHNSTGNLTDVGYNRTTGGTGGRGGKNDTVSRNATIPMPNGTSAVPGPPSSPTNNPSSLADVTITAKTTAVTLALAVFLLVV